MTTHELRGFMVHGFTITAERVLGPWWMRLWDWWWPPARRLRRAAWFRFTVNGADVIKVPVAVFERRGRALYLSTTFAGGVFFLKPRDRFVCTVDRPGLPGAYQVAVNMNGMSYPVRDAE